MTAKDILEEVLSFTGCTANSFANAIGLTRSQALYDIQNGKTKSITQQMADKIVQKFPEIRRSWLITGEGSMLVERDTKGACKNDLQRIRELLAGLKISGAILNDSDFATKTGVNRSYVSELRNGKRGLTTNYVEQICSNFPGVSRVWLLTGNGTMFVEENQNNSEFSHIRLPNNESFPEHTPISVYCTALRESQQQITQLIQSLQTAQEQLTVMTQRLADSQTQVDNLIRVLATNKTESVTMR